MKMKVELIKILKELNFRKPPQEGCLNIIWLSDGNPEKFDIDLNRSMDNIHGAVNGEQGYYYSDGKVWEVL